MISHGVPAQESLKMILTHDSLAPCLLRLGELCRVHQCERKAQAKTALYSGRLGAVKSLSSSTELL